jgi:hypothetical protein
MFMEEEFEAVKSKMLDGTWVVVLSLPGYQLILRQVLKPVGELPASNTLYHLWECPCHACCGFVFKLWGE